MRYLILGAVMALGAVTPVWAQDVDIQLTPGLYAFETEVTMAGHAYMDTEPYEYCIPEERARTSLSEQLEKFAEGGECTFSGITQTSHAAQGQFSCYSPDVDMTINGEVKGEYSPKHYSVTTTAFTPMGEHRAHVTARWMSPCPEGWTPPPGISHE